MIWLFGIAVIFFLIVSEGFRAFIIVIIILGGVIGIALWLYGEREDKLSKKRILTSEIMSEGAILKPSYSGYNFISRITNKGLVNFS